MKCEISKYLQWHSKTDMILKITVYLFIHLEISERRYIFCVYFEILRFVTFTAMYVCMCIYIARTRVHLFHPFSRKRRIVKIVVKVKECRMHGFESESNYFPVTSSVRKAMGSWQWWELEKLCYRKNGNKKIYTGLWRDTYKYRCWNCSADISAWKR